MLEVSTVIFAVAISVAALGVAWSTISASAATALRQDARLTAHAQAIQKLRSEMATRTPTALTAELDDLRGALDVIRHSNRKEFGALWGKMGGRGANNGKVTTHDEDDEELQALLALQQPGPTTPPQ